MVGLPEVTWLIGGSQISNFGGSGTKIYALDCGYPLFYWSPHFSEKRCVHTSDMVLNAKMTHKMLILAESLVPDFLCYCKGMSMPLDLTRHT